MSKKKTVKVSECCVITSDDKGQRSLVGKAKEALTTMDKNGVDVSIMLEHTDKESAEKFLKENNVPYKELLTREDMKDGTRKFDCVVVDGDNVVTLRSDWAWALNDITNKLYGEGEKSHKTEQEKLDDRWKEYKSWAEKANKITAG